MKNFLAELAAGALFVFGLLLAITNWSSNADPLLSFVASAIGTVVCLAGLDWRIRIISKGAEK